MGDYQLLACALMLSELKETSFPMLKEAAKSKHGRSPQEFNLMATVSGRLCPLFSALAQDTPSSKK